LLILLLEVFRLLVLLGLDVSLAQTIADRTKALLLIIFVHVRIINLVFVLFRLQHIRLLSDLDHHRDLFHKLALTFAQQRNKARLETAAAYQDTFSFPAIVQQGIDNHQRRNSFDACILNTFEVRTWLASLKIN
jgi:hypothetical protein